MARREQDNRTTVENHIQARASIYRHISILFIVIVVVGLVLWLYYRPSNPEFAVVGAAIYRLNVSTHPSQLSTTMKFNIVTRNPNKHASIYYDELTGMVLYKDQQITPEVMLSPLVNEKRSTVEISPVLDGAAVPVTEEVANEIGRSGSEIWVRVVLMGRVKWKLGGIKIGYYGVCVKCDVLVNNNTKKGLVGSVPLPHPTPCMVDF